MLIAESFKRLIFLAPIRKKISKETPGKERMNVN